MKSNIPLKVKVSVPDYIKAGGELKEGLTLIKDFVSYLPTTKLIRYDKFYEKWVSNDNPNDKLKETLIDLNYFSIEINVLEFSLF